MNDEGESPEEAPSGKAPNEDAATAGGTDTAAVDEADQKDADFSETSVYARPEEAMVAVRGDARVGLGVIVKFEGRSVVLTTLSALDGSRRMVVNTADGETLPITGIVGAMDRDLAMLNIEEGEWPTAELKMAPAIKKNGTMTVFLPRRKESLTVEDNGSTRLKVKSPEAPVYPGAPVSSGGAVVALYSPERNVSGMGTTRGATIGPIWPDGIVPVSTTIQWEAINLPTMASERENLRENARIIREGGAFLGVGSRDTTVSLQPLLSARDRLGSSFQRSTQEVEKNQARRGFVHSVSSVIGGVESNLTRDLETSYSYFVPEIRVLMELYQPIGKKLDQLARNPRAADSFAR